MKLLASLPQVRPLDAAATLTCPLCNTDDSAVAHVGRHMLADVEIEQETRVCRTCGMTFEHARPDFVWEQLYGTVWQRGAEKAPYLDALYDNDARILGPGRGRRVVDVGCGPGYLLDRLKEQGWNTAGCEPETAVADQARAKGHDVYAGLFEPRAEHRCELLILGDILEHVSRPRKLLADAHAVLNKNGLLYVRVPRLDLEAINYESFGDVFALQHRTWFTAESLQTMLTLEGFDVLRIQPHGSGMNALARRLDSASNAPPGRPALEPERSLEIVAAYSRDLAARRERIAAKLEGLHGRSVALYGGGTHASELLSETVLGRLATRVVDGNPALHGTRCGALRIAAPASLRTSPPDVVVVASKAYQAEIAASLADLAGRGVEIVELYERSGHA